MEQGSTNFYREVGSAPPLFFLPNTPPPLRRRTHANHVHLKVEITSMGSAA